MVIADRFEHSEKQNTIRRAKSKSGRACFVAMSRESRTDTPFPPSRHSKSLREHWTFPCTNYFMMGRNRPSFSTFQNERSATMSHGEALARMKECFTSFVAS